MVAAGKLRAILDIVDHAYAAVVDPQRWEDALRSFAAILDARAAGVRVECLGQGAPRELPRSRAEPGSDEAVVRGDGGLLGVE